MNSVIGRLSAIADRPENTDEERLQHRFLISTGMIMSAGGVLWGVVAAGMGLLQQSSIPFGYVIITGINLFVLARTKKFARARTIQVFISILLPFMFQWSLGGLVASGGTMLWSMLCLSAVQSFEDRNLSRRWLAFFILLVFVSLIVEMNNPPPLHLFQNEDLIKIPLYLFTMNFVAVSLAIFVLISIFMKLRREMADELVVKTLRIEQSQRALVQSEKLAAIGELVAGVAHELNTPLGAIRSSNRNLDRSIRSIMAALPALNAITDEAQKAAVANILQRIGDAPDNRSTREERAARRALDLSLQDRNYPNPSELASQLSEIGIFEPSPEFDPILKSNSWPAVFEQLRSFASLKRNCSNIQVAADRSAKIVFALKSHAHPGHEGEFYDGSIAANIDTALILYNNLIRRGIKVVTRYDVSTEMTADHNALNQVWTNLIHNALQAMGGEGTLVIEVRRDREAMIVEIEDSGPGIPPTLKDKIFEPFFTSKETGEGTGLGLSISADIVRRHNGRIEVDSAPGRTMFRVRLPIVSRPAIEAEADDD